MKNALALVVLAVAFSILVVGAEIHIPADAPFAGTVLIAESFYEIVDDKEVPLEVAVWQGANGVRNTEWFDTRIEAHPGDVVILDPGQYKVDVWILAPQITLTTDQDTGGIADIWGTVEVDADGVILDHIAVTGPRKDSSSGHGIEVNRELVDTITIRGCLIEGNEWMGIHVIGPRGMISEMRIENCVVKDNGSYGIEAQSVDLLIITGCKITGNDQGIHIGSNIDSVVLEGNLITGNRSADVFRKE